MQTIITYLFILLIIYQNSKKYNYFLADDVYLEQQAQAQVEQQKQSNEYLMMGQQYYNYEAAGKTNYTIILNYH